MAVGTETRAQNGTCWWCVRGIDRRRPSVQRILGFVSAAVAPTAWAHKRALRLTAAQLPALVTALRFHLRIG